MEYKVLNNGIKMPMVGFGTFLNNGDECEKSVCQAIQAGYRLIDTAEAYGNEKEVGKGIQLSGIDRKELFIVTKVNFKSYENTYHAYRELENMYEEGLIRSIGISNYQESQYVDLIHFNKVVPVVNQLKITLRCQRKQMNEVMKVRGTLLQGYQVFGKEETLAIYEDERVKEIALKYHKTTRQIAMKYLVQKGISVITRPMQKQWMKDNLNLFDFTLNEDEMNYLTSFDLLEYNTKPSQDYQRTLSMLEK